MSFKSVAAACAVFLLTGPVLAEGAKIQVQDPYARASNTMAGAAFMVLENTGDEDDRLISVESDVSKRIELHTHKENSDGVMQMIHVEEGFVIPAGGSHSLKRGGDHVMFMGLNDPMEHGETVTVTLVFEKAGPITVEIPVDLERKPAHGGHGSGG